MKNIINLKPNLKDTILARMDDIDKVMKKDINSQNPKQASARIKRKNSGKNENKGKNQKDVEDDNKLKNLKNDLLASKNKKMRSESKGKNHILN